MVSCWYPELLCKAVEAVKQCPDQSGHPLVVHFSFCSLCWGFGLPQQEVVVCTGGLNCLNSSRDNALLTVSIVRNSMRIKTRKKKKIDIDHCVPSAQSNLPCTWILYIHVLFPKTTWYNQHHPTHHSCTTIFDFQDEVKFWHFEKG